MPTAPCPSCQMPVKFRQIADGTAVICPACGKRMVLRKKETPNDAPAERPQKGGGAFKDFLYAQAKVIAWVVIVILTVFFAVMARQLYIMIKPHL